MKTKLRALFPGASAHALADEVQGAVAATLARREWPVPLPCRSRVTVAGTPLGPDCLIEFASAADLPALADLLDELFALESDFVPARDKQLAGLRLILDNPALGQLFVLRVDGRIAGMANALITVSTAQGARVLLLEDVIVGASYRAAGLGRALVEHVCAWAKRAGMARVTLLADKDNTAALAFYERLGFESSAMVVRRKPL